MFCTAPVVENWDTVQNLGQYFRINQILSPVLRDLRQSPLLEGFKIVVAGRLTRKERAAFMVRKNNRVTLSKKSALIDFSSQFKIMRFGMVGIKTWFMRKHANYKPYFYRFSIALLPWQALNNKKVVLVNSGVKIFMQKRFSGRKPSGGEWKKVTETMGMGQTSLPRQSGHVPNPLPKNSPSNSPTTPTSHTTYSSNARFMHNDPRYSNHNAFNNRLPLTPTTTTPNEIFNRRDFHASRPLLSPIFRPSPGTPYYSETVKNGIPHDVFVHQDVVDGKATQSLGVTTSNKNVKNQDKQVDEVFTLDEKKQPISGKNKPQEVALKHGFTVYQDIVKKCGKEVGAASKKNKDSVFDQIKKSREAYDKQKQNNDS